MSDPRNCFNFMQKHFLNYHCVGASLTFLCHLYCKSSHPYGAFLTFWGKKKVYLCVISVFFQVFVLSATVFNVPYLRIIEQTWTVNITCSCVSVVLRKCAFYTLRNMKQGKLSVSFRGQLACCGVFNYCNLTVR